MGANVHGRRRRAIIIGGSMSGLFAASFLRQAGWDADVYERSRVELVGRGAGITGHPELMEALEASGAGTRDLGIEVHRRIALDGDGNIIAERLLTQTLTSWDRLQRLLRQTIDPAHYHLGHTFKHAEQDPDGVTVHFTEGKSVRGDILVGGDGVRSSVRAQVAPTLQPIYAGYFIWRGTANEADMSPLALETIYPYFTFFVPERQQVICYPIAGFDDDLRPGHRRYNFIWYRVGDSDLLHRMCLDENGRQHDFSVPPPLIRKDLIASMRAEGEALLPPALRDTLRVIKQPFFTPIYDFASPQLVFGRIVLVGDAASTSRPHMGFGVSKAGGDAQALGAALAACGDDIDAGLSRYNAERQEIGERIMLHSRKLGTHLKVDLRTDADRRMSAMLQDPGAFMDWIAVPNFLEQRTP